MASKPVVVIGAGAAGIFAALRAAEMGAKVTLLEKTPRIGTKVLISGGGKCNVTHDGTVENVLRAFRPNEARFLRRSFYRLTNATVRQMFEDEGLELYVRPDGRLFPVDKTAKHVVGIMRQWLDRAGVELRLETPVIGLRSTMEGIVAELPTGDLPPGPVVLCVGGASYPNSGTTGDGWPWAETLGHSIVKLRAALSPIYLPDLDGLPKSGVSVRDVLLKARQDGKEFARWRGDLLFTHQGISGPCALGISREAQEGMEKGPVSLEIDLLPDLSFEDLMDGFLNATDDKPKEPIGYCVPGELPRSVLEIFFDMIEVEGWCPVSQFPKKPRNRLIELLKGWPIGMIGEVPLDRGEVTAGGISLDEVDHQTMASKVCPGLFVAGEALDIAGPVGGYNLQAAFSCGYVAGESAATWESFSHESL